jgi:hypothetical protein
MDDLSILILKFKEAKSYRVFSECIKTTVHH